MQNLHSNNMGDRFRQIIRSGEWLEDDHMDRFGQLLASSSEYAPQQVWKKYLPHTIEPISPMVKHLQILHSGSTDLDMHWVCAYFDTKSIYIYDSLNKKTVHKDHQIYLEKLFPFYAFDSNPVQFPTVQHQPNGSDCGVFAIAFAISIVNGHHPDEVIYDVPLMRRHLLQIFESNKIQNFPCVRKIKVSDPKPNIDFSNTELHCIQKSYSQQLVCQKLTSTVLGSSNDHRKIPVIKNKKNCTPNSKSKVPTENTQSKVTGHLATSRDISNVAHGDRVNVNANTATKTRRQKIRNAPPSLDNKSKLEIMSGEWLTDLHMSRFAYLLQSCTEYSPRETWRIQMPSTIAPVSATQKHIQILHSGDNHWVCCYFDTKSIFIYDSLNSKRLHKHHETFLRHLFPFYQFDCKPIRFPTVQQQPNFSDCGVFAIAFAISLANGHRPSDRIYDVSRMRAHLLALFENNVIDEFPRVNVRQRMRTRKNTSPCKRKLLSTSVEHLNLQQNEKRRPRPTSLEQRAVRINKHTSHGGTQYKTAQTEIDVTHSSQIRSCSKITEVAVTTECNQALSQERRVSIVNLSKESMGHVRPYVDNFKPLDDETVEVLVTNSKPVIKSDQLATSKCTFNISICDKRSNHCDIDVKRIKNRSYYLSNADKLRVRARKIYSLNAVNQRSRKRKHHHLNAEKSREKMRRYYRLNAEKSRERMRKYHTLNAEKSRETMRRNYRLNVDKRRALRRIRYQLNRERDRRCDIYSIRRKENEIAKRKKKTAKKILTKYQSIRNLNTIALMQSKEKYIAKISLMIEEQTDVLRRMKAESIIKWCIRDRELGINIMRKNLVSVKNKAQVCLTKFAKLSNANIGDKLNVLCGSSKHIASAEPYFVEAAYKYVPFYESIVVNPKGQAVNILPLVENNNKTRKSRRKGWSCDRSCKITDISLVEKYVKFLKLVSMCTLKNVHKFIIHLKCTAKHANDKLGHSQVCYMDDASCRSIFLPVQILSAHFPLVRRIQRLVYKLQNCYTRISIIDKALNDGDLEKLQQISETAQQNANNVQDNVNNDIDLNEEEIRKKYESAFHALTKRSMDIPRLICVSCEKLCFKREITNIDKFRRPITTKIWADLMKRVKSEGNDCEYVCNYCLPKLRQNTMPPRCILNNLITEPVPEMISSLNDYERILIQRAKAFQTVQRMGTVANKNLPHRDMVQKVKGRTFHLPLPMEETLQKICPPMDPINLDHELYILVRGIPTKSKLVWEQLVNIHKVWDALIWLKANNPHYSEIKLPESAETLLADIKDTEFQEEDEEVENENNEDDKLKELEIIHNVATVITSENNENDNLEECEGRDNINNANRRAALLTQVSQSDEIYEQFTIHPMYAKRPNETATDLYQMLKINDVPLDNRHKTLDLQCFPHLYPYGRNGQQEDRSTRLTHAEFIKSRLMSKHSQYRLDQQYLFYLLNDANIRQVRSGIYYKLNITNPSERFTAASYLEKLSREELEGNLNAIFARLRNTEQYWSRPRNDVSCMMHHYGPATWFLTLSPSEWLWSDMAEYLREVGGPAAATMSPNQLIAADPVSTSRFINNKFHAMLDFICSPDHPIGEVTHYFWRREYQGRGMQHFHLLIWIKDAPVIGKSSNKEIASFITKYVTCKMPPKYVSPELYRRVNTHQRHKHNSYCLRSKKNKNRGSSKVCRFGFPRPVTDNIVIRDVAVSIIGRRKLKSRSRLYDLPRNQNEVDINDYNPAILSAWEGNMDIQFIGEISAILMWYVTKYLSKCEKSNTDKDIAAINSTKSLCSRLWSFAQRMLNHRECGALEAADTLIGISLHGTDPQTTIKWIDVNIIRNRKVKSRKEIEALDADSTDIFCDSVVDTHYPARPQELESTCLYDFVKWYEVTRVEPKVQDVEFYKIGKTLYLKKRKRGCLINHYKNNVNNQPERYYFALLLLFQPWRDTDELRNGCDTYAEAFESVQLELEDALQYHERIAEIQKGIEHIKDTIEKRMKEKAQSQQSDTSDSIPLGCGPIEAEEAMKEFQARVNKSYTANDSQIIRSLNIDQKRVFDATMAAVNSNDTILRHYVSGEGGTGKSHLIEALVRSIKQHTGKDTAVTAPTGIAAFNVNGLTIHRLFQLPVEHGVTPKYKQLSDAALKVIREQLKNVALVIIDEVSMISNVTFMYIHLRLSEIFDTIDCEDGWFGKKHILLFGDLLQLPPVRENPAFMRLSSEVSNKLLGSMGSVDLWNNLFSYDELTINMRQKNDESYREILSRIRIGVATDSDTAILASRKIRFTNFTSSTFDERVRELCDYINNLPNDAVCLLPTIRMCEVLNEAMLGGIQSEKIELIAHDTVDCPKYIKKKVHKILNMADEDCSRTAGLAKLITVKIGAKVMIRRNIDVTLGLVNGTIGKITSVSRAVDTSDVEAVRIVLATGVEHVIERVDVKFEAMEGAFVIRRQFPICLSYGITIHKSQGLSLNNAVIDAGNSIFASGQVYVALSRVTSLQGLHLINYDPHAVLADESAILEYNRLRKQYRPDLMAMTVPGIRPRKVQDRRWSVSRDVSTCQVPIIEEKISSHEWRVKGLQNADGVSCYANAAIQCLFHCTPIRNCFFNQQNDDVMKILIQNYINLESPGNVFHARRLAGKEFTLNVQQDAPEFLNSILSKYDDLRNVVKHELTSLRCCKDCGFTSTTTEVGYILLLALPPPGKKNITLADIINHNFSRWQTVNELSCEICGSKNILMKTDVSSASSCLIVQLRLTYVQDGQIKKITDYNIKAVPTDRPLLCAKKYKVINAIFHHGPNIQEGHYTCMLRDGTSAWQHVNDNEINKQSWIKNARNAYIFFLQRT